MNIFQLHAEIKGTERIERWEYPIEAIREAVTNAICHRNYKISSNLVVTFRGKITKEYLKGLDLNKGQIIAMESIKKIGKITNKGYREMFPEISNETARLDLNTLLRKRLLNKKIQTPVTVLYLCEIYDKLKIS
jgi:ATP-dependent DNA helicase RecG